MIILILTIISLLIWFELFHKKRVKDFGKSFPGPPTWPLLGNALDFWGTPVEFLTFLCECGWKYGKRYRITGGPDVSIILSDPKDAEVILSSMQLLDKAEDYDLLHPWLGRGLLTSTGVRWHKHRKFITPAFHFNILRHFVPIFDSKTDSFIKKMESYATGDIIDIYPFVVECTLDQLVETAMGVSLDHDDEKNLEYINAVKQMTVILNDRMKSLLIRYDLIFFFNYRYRKYKKALNTLHKFTNDMIKSRKQFLNETHATLKSVVDDEDDDGIENKRKNVAFLDLLLLADLDGEKLDDTSIREEVDTFMFEGHDTTASSIAFTLYLLGEYPNIQEQLKDEQDKIFSGDNKRETSYKDLTDMKYLDMAIRESLRLYPSVPMIGRQVTKETEINDMKVPPGVGLVIHVFNMNRDPELFDEPLKFKPERFLPEEIKKRNPYSNVSFSAGPRNCIGQKFAMYEMKMTLSKIIRNFEILSANGPALQLAGDIVLKSANGVHIKLQKRQ